MSWVVRIVVGLGALLSAVTGVLGLFAPETLLRVLGHSGEPVTDGAVQLAAYVGARELPMAVVLLWLLVKRSDPILAVVLLLFAAANAVDAIDALVFERWAQLPGAATFALAAGAAGLWLVRRQAIYPGAPQSFSDIRQS